MNTRTAILTTLIFLLCPVYVLAQTSAFSYQGNLTDGANEASGTYQMRFSLYDTASGGTQIGQTLEYGAVEVEGGLFSVTLDFGASAFDGSERYLEIEVRRNSGEAYVPLAPRQKIDSAPYAVRSLNAQNADTLDGLDSSQFVTGSSNDFIRNGTTAQTGDFNISGTGRADIFNADTQYNLGGVRILSSPNFTNIFIGNSAGSSNTTGNNNTFIGRGAGLANTTGGNNSFYGRNAGIFNTIGNENSFFGWEAGNNNNVGSQNSFFGSEAGRSNREGAQNSFFGAQAGQSNTFGNFNVFLGYRAGANNTLGNNNTFTGSNAGTANGVGSSNSFYGFNAGSNNTLGDNNSFFGSLAGRDNTIGQWNSFYGASAGEVNSTGTNNSFFGYQAGKSNTDGLDNTFVGRSAGRQNTGGDSNSFFGVSAGFNTTTGSNNTFIGKSAGSVNTTGNNNTMIGYDAETIGNNLNYATAIGADSTVSTSNTIQLGRPADRTVVSGELTVLAGEDTPVDRGDINFLTGSGNLDVYFQGGNGTKGINFGVDSGATNAKLFISQFDGTTYQDRVVVNETGAVEIRQLGPGGSTDVCRNSNNELATCSSSIRYKTGVTDFTPGLDVVRKLRPVFYKWKDGGMPDVGLVAEEVSEIEPLLTTEREGRVEGVKYDRLGVVLVNAVQEQQAQIDIQQKELAKQQRTIEEQRITIEEQKISNTALRREVKRQKERIDRLERLVCSLAVNAEICQEEKQ